MIAGSDFRHYKFGFANARPGRPRKLSHWFAAGELGSLAVDGLFDFTRNTGGTFTVGTILY
jgi:hypothetical protein